jgi:hypothetical protein
MHTLVAALPEHCWTLWQREDNWSVVVAKSNRLQPVVEQALNIAFAPNVTADLTFSTRPVDVVIADLIEAPEQLATGAPGCWLHALCREGRLNTSDDRWASVQRQHTSTDVFSIGLDSVFRPQTLRAQVDGFFESQGWHTFAPPRPHRNESVAPPWGRELLVRHGNAWRARQICPSAFPVQPKAA